jgi:hypothetical protein
MKIHHIVGLLSAKYHGAKSCREERVVAPSYVFAGVGGYYASKQSGLAGVFRRATDGTDWKHALSEVETFDVFVHPHDPNLVFAGTADGVYRSTDRGQNFRRADFPDRGVQVWHSCMMKLITSRCWPGVRRLRSIAARTAARVGSAHPIRNCRSTPRCRFPAA